MAGTTVASTTSKGSAATATTTKSAASATSSACAADDGCINQASSMIQTCAYVDMQCMCDKTTTLALCFNGCEEDARFNATIRENQAYCFQASQSPSGQAISAPTSLSAQSTSITTTSAMTIAMADQESSQRTLKDAIIVFSVLGVFVVIAVVIGLLNWFGYKWPKHVQRVVEAVRQKVMNARGQREERMEFNLREKDLEGMPYVELETNNGKTSELWTVSNVSELEGSPPVPPKNDIDISPRTPRPRRL